MAPKARHVVKFQVEDGDQTYECRRIITGTSTLDQIIEVAGVGSRSDPASYGEEGHPVSTMADIARMIAHEIIAARKK